MKYDRHKIYKLFTIKEVREILAEDAAQSIEKYINTISRDEEPTPKRIKEYVEQLKRDGWGNKRIINHFAKFGITIPI